MPYGPNDLVREISRTIQDALDRDVTMPAPFIQAEVMRQHILPTFEGEYRSHRGFYLFCANAHVRNEVHKVLKRFKAPEPLDRELTLPGFKFLQKGYLVKRQHRVRRKGKMVYVTQETLVPVNQLSDEELETKALDYEAMADGCRRHAAELRRYKRERKIAA
jgi:hypothetical protein